MTTSTTPAATPPASSTQLGAPPAATTTPAAAPGAAEAAGKATPPAGSTTPPPAGGTSQAPTETPPAELKFPDGTDAGLMEAFRGVAGELKLEAPAAQKIVDSFTKAQSALFAKWDSEAKAERAKWSEEIKADKEFGGQAFDANVQHARRAVAKYGGTDLAKLLDSTGLGDHPVVLRTFMRLGKALAEDSVAGTTNTPATASNGSLDLKKLYPNTKFKE